MKITNIRENAMGTISFDAKFKGMNKPQDFIVYPNPEPGRIKVQSDTRCGVITGDKVVFAKVKYFAQVPFAMTVTDTIENAEELREAIRKTAGDMVGNNGIVYCDNSQAAHV